MSKLNGKIALVTGAGTGIGKETAILLAEGDAHVILTGRRLEPLQEVVGLIESRGGKAKAYALDIESRSAARDTVEAVKRDLGSIDILVNNAGRASKVLDARFISEDEWNAVVNVNLTAVFNLTQAVLPDMLKKGQGTIIAVASGAAINPNLLGGAAYGPAKAGVKSFMTFLHNTYRNQGIRATTVLPGETNTPILDKRPRQMTDAEKSRLMDPRDVAETIVLCARLADSAVVTELHVTPTFLRDTSADIETARNVGAPK